MNSFVQQIHWVNLNSLNLNLYSSNNQYQMSSNPGLNHLIMKRIQTGLGKSKQAHSKGKKINDRIFDANMEAINLNLSVDVKNHMTKEKDQFIRQRPSNTISIELQNQKANRKNKLLFFSSKRQYETSNEKSVKLAYGNSSPKAIKQRVQIYTSQKTIKEKRKRFSLSTNNRGESELLENVGSDSSPDYTQSKQHQTVNMEKHMIITKYEKVKQLLKEQKYAQASIYLKQIIPYIEDKNKKKELYFWLIASLMKSNSHNKLQTIESYIVECLEQFPNFYDVYLYWAKTKIIQDLHEDAIEIYEKAIRINSKNSQAYVELANIFMKNKLYKDAFKILQQGFSHSINSVSIPTKIIENYKLFQLSLDFQAQPYLDRIQSNCGKKSTEFLWIQGFIQKEKNNLNEALIYFLESLKYNSNKNLATKSLQNLIKIHIANKDFYAACYDLKRSKFLNIDVKKMEKYEIFLEGVNFVMKKQNQEGIKLLNKIKDVSAKTTSKKRINTFVPTATTEDSKISFADDPQIMSLTIKYLAYAHFKLGNHKQAIKCYKLLQKIDKELDKTSKYNMLLAQGVVLANFYQDFQNSLSKFQQAKSFLCKVEPWIYQAVVTVQKQVYRQKKNTKNKGCSEITMEQELNSAVISALNIMEEGFQVNSSSSNLLYHRTILHLYFSSLKTAMQDINVCIQKAEQNLPKYFYLRGICFACLKNLKKAINEFSISISLSKEYSLAYLQRAKCYFLSGETEMGFQDLKIYMDQCPNDSLVHKWIGDLLFQGTSYNDSIKAYNEMGNKVTIDALCMKMKAELRVSSIKTISETMNSIKSHSEFTQQAFGIDLAAFGLFSTLINSSSSSDREKYIKEIDKRVKELNQFLEGDDVEKGRIFNLVDCMSLVGIGNFYSQKYVEAYESFLLVLEFLKSTKGRHSEKNKIDASEEYNSELEEQEVVQKQKLNTQFQEQSFDLREEDVYYNMFVCLLALKDYQSIRKLAQEQMVLFMTNKTQKKVIQKILVFISEHKGDSERPSKVSNPNSIPISFAIDNSKNSSKLKAKKDNITCLFEPRIQNSLNSALKRVQITMPMQKGSLTIKTSMMWTSYHGSNDNLNFTTFAKKIVNELHAGYIDNMPQGPWIRRNEFGVLFTDNILDEGNESSFITTNRPEDQVDNETYGNEDFEEDKQAEEYEDESQQPYNKKKEEDTIEERKKAFLKEMKLDLGVESKLNKIIKKD